MKIVFSDHAKARLKQRKILRKFIAETVNNPDNASLSYRGRRTFRKQICDRIIEVVAIIEDKSLVIVTAYYL
ncbi:MAG: DUF4258 domain-containing protein [bacterium]|nr:DUF4258 domain-containing protein [bacterium]